jgi:lipoate synthase
MTTKQKGEAKTARIPIKVVPAETVLKKPSWIRVKAGNSAARFGEIKQILREHHLHTVCEEATCPNIGECFGKGTATFMILGDLCTRRCPFCDVGHGKPLPPDADEPEKLARTIAAMKLKYVVITSVDRDDLRDGGAQHFADCIAKVREYSPGTKIEVLVPDFRGRLEIAIEILAATPPDVMNHNMETVPRLYKQARPRRRLRALVAVAESLQGARAERADQVRFDGWPGRDRRGNPGDAARPARPRRRDADHRPVPRTFGPPPAGVALRASRHLCHVCPRGRGDGLQQCRQRAAGAFQLSRRHAGARGRRQLGLPKSRRWRHGDYRACARRFRP